MFPDMGFDAGPVHYVAKREPGMANGAIPFVEKWNGLAPIANHPFGSLATPREETRLRWAHGFASSSRDEFAHSRMRI
jgi:hypothetical protein